MGFPRGNWQGLETFVDVTPGGAPGLEPGMLRNTPQCPEYPLPTESDLRWRILTHLTKNSKNTGLCRLGVGNFPPWEKSFNLALPRHLQVGLEIQQIQEVFFITT